MYASDGQRSPGRKLLLAILIGLALAIPLFSTWLLVYDRQSQSDEARASITEGWGGQQSISGPVLVIPYRTTATEISDGLGKTVKRTRNVIKELTLEPEAVEMKTKVTPQLRKRSIYEAVVYDANIAGSARFAFPPDLARYGLDPATLDLGRAELRFGISDPRGLGANPRVRVEGRAVRLQPGGGSGPGRGFFAFVDAAPLNGRPLMVAFDYDFRGNSSLALAPHAGDTHWAVSSAWPHPSFGGSFLPGARTLGAEGFTADYRIGNLALGRALVSTGDKGSSDITASTASDGRYAAVAPAPGGTEIASIDLIQPVDLYSRVNRATKYGFLFIGFTFLALLMFDIIGGVRVTAVEYLLMGAAIVLFFVLLLAFAEVIGFTAAYIVASAAIAGLNTAYSAAVLGSWKRGYVIGGLLIGLYAVLYILLGLEAFSLLIGSILLFVALGGVMFATRRIDWSGTAPA
ncbi:MAG: cell envelope integrity protein CreD [Sphingomonas sp.]|uniref:cell envelope integrity protein CreD n=1 Tax=Sphingomonas sp. TaxID=28214 RepID=UPI0017A9417B|nr:cell envelope integrity protein CreD [Sphingomonas sp.]MBA3667695.1 cell envelope integrity protein CreD [Sphingomonas sp.]